MEWAVYRTDPPRAPAQASTRVPRHMSMASCGRQPQVSPLSPTGVQAVLSARWQSRQVPGMFQWVAVGGCIPHIPRAAPTQLGSQNSCTNLRWHPGKFLPCLLPLPPLLHPIYVVFMTFFCLMIDYRAPSTPVLGLLFKC